VKVLLDTHVFLWLLADDPRLPATARAVAEDVHVVPLLSVASVWEMAIKVALGKLALPSEIGTFVPEALARTGVQLLPIEVAHVARTERLPHLHRDPFDRLLVAQAQQEGCRLMSGDAHLRGYDVTVLW
jgi:PIN domain nuclease of toxin-antitoxin system